MCLCLWGGGGQCVQAQKDFLIGRAQGCQILSLRPLYDKSITFGRIPEAPGFSQAHNPLGFYPQRGWEERRRHRKSPPWKPPPQPSNRTEQVCCAAGGTLPSLNPLGHLGSNT